VLLSRLWRILRTGQPAETDYALVDYNGDGNNEVWRGGCIGIMGGTSASPQQNISVVDLEIDGTAHYTGNTAWPASTVNGDGWDITHRGVWCNQDKYIYNVLVQNCNIHGFKGELTYSAGPYIKNHSLLNNNFDDSNGEATNFSDGTFAFNTVGQMCLGFEPVPMSGMNLKVFNNILNGPFKTEGISIRIFENIAGSTASAEIHDNEIHLGNIGILLTEMKNVRVYNNTVVDCTTYGIRAICDSGNNYQPRKLSNSEIINNRIIARLKSLMIGLDLALSSYGATNSIIRNNFSILSENAVSGVTLGQPFALESGTGLIDNTCVVNDNHGNGTTYKSLEAMMCKEKSNYFSITLGHIPKKTK
jgi:hypothetical protein